jgi:chloride channel protein, CIC family
MGAILGGTMRSPFTGVVFALELTHDVNMMLPLLVAVSIAHGFTVLVLRRSILTEKVARRGYHLSREYAVDPLEILFAREVMETRIVALAPSSSLAALTDALQVDPLKGPQRLYPIIGSTDRLLGVVPRVELQTLVDTQAANPDGQLAAITRTTPTVAFSDEPLRVIVHRMAETSLTRFPVVERGTMKVVGIVALDDLLKARARNLDSEKRRERILRIAEWRLQSAD